MNETLSRNPDPCPIHRESGRLIITQKQKQSGYTSALIQYQCGEPDTTQDGKACRQPLGWEYRPRRDSSSKYYRAGPGECDDLNVLHFIKEADHFIRTTILLFAPSVMALAILIALATYGYDIMIRPISPLDSGLYAALVVASTIGTVIAGWFGWRGLRAIGRKHKLEVAALQDN